PRGFPDLAFSLGGLVEFVALVPSKNEPVLDAFGLRVIKRRKLGPGRGLRLVENTFSHCLQSAPARPIQLRRMGNLAEDAAPFNNDAVDVSSAEQLGDPCAFAERIFVNGGDDLFGAGTVLGRHSV